LPGVWKSDLNKKSDFLIFFQKFEIFSNRANLATVVACRSFVFGMAATCSIAALVLGLVQSQVT